MNDVEHPNNPDPTKRNPNTPQYRPEADLLHDDAEVVESVRDYFNLRKLAQLAGGPVDTLKEI